MCTPSIRLDSCTSGLLMGTCTHLTPILSSFYNPCLANNFTIAGVRNGLITAWGEKGEDRIVLTAHLPAGYFEQKNVVGGFDSEFLKKFEPLQVLGEGAFGCVFKVQHRMDNCVYAVKRIPLRGSDREISVALNEVRTLASLVHEGIVRYNNSWIEKPPPECQTNANTEILRRLRHGAQLNYTDDCVFLYIQMELSFYSLFDWLYTNSTRNVSQAKVWMKQLVSAVGYLHSRNKIHRDLKPPNSLFDKEGRIKICDLGLVADRAIRS